MLFASGVIEILRAKELQDLGLLSGVRPFRRQSAPTGRRTSVVREAVGANGGGTTEQTQVASRGQWVPRGVA